MTKDRAQPYAQPYAVVQRFVDSLAHCRHLGIQVEEAGPNHLVLSLPWRAELVGNPVTQVIHGGAITTLMDTSCGSVLSCALPAFELCPTLDLRVDYMRAARPHHAVYARARCFRTTPAIIFVRCEAYQLLAGAAPDADEITAGDVIMEEGERTIAHCVATFMRIGSAAVPAAYRNAIVHGAAHDESG